MTTVAPPLAAVTAAMIPPGVPPYTTTSQTFRGSGTRTTGGSWGVGDGTAAGVNACLIGGLADAVAPGLDTNREGSGTGAGVGEGLTAGNTVPADSRGWRVGRGAAACGTSLGAAGRSSFIATVRPVGGCGSAIWIGPETGECDPAGTGDRLASEPQALVTVATIVSKASTDARVVMSSRA
jgi:hypothetical protein